MQYIYLLICYVLGSIPVGLLVGYAAGVDVREHGSGNIGFTNVLRVCGKSWGIPVLILDMAKGFAPVFFLSGVLLEGGEYSALWAAIGGVVAVLGHNFPVWLKFKGGKGVATGAGVLAALMPVPFVIGLGIWIALVVAFRYVSLGSMIGAFSVFVCQSIMTRDDFLGRDNIPSTIIAFSIWALVMISHRSNIKRLLAGEENKIGAKAKNAAETTTQESSESA